MSDPKRLLDNSSHGAEPVRRALEAARAVRPVDQLTQEVWTALSAKLPLAPNGSGTPPSSDPGSGSLGSSFADGAGGSLAGGGGSVLGGSAATITVATVIKAIGTGMALGALVSVGAFAVTDAPSSPAVRASESRTNEPRANESRANEPRANELLDPPVTAPGLAFRAPGARMQTPGQSARPAESAVALAPGRSHSEQGRAGPAQSSPPAARTVEREDRQTIDSAASGPTEAPLPRKSSAAFLPAEAPSPEPRAIEASLQPAEGSDALEEGRLLANARKALRGGSPQRALEVLEGATRKFARGHLVQEREVLLIEALFATKRTSLAHERASRFLRDHPGSAHAARVRAFLR
jgi:hypothetical protein